MSDIAVEIARADAGELERILKAVLQRYAELFPYWEVNTFSVYKCDDRNEQIDRTIEMLLKMKTSP